MIFVDNENITDPRINLAIEEHLLRNLKVEQDILLFYINEPSIIIGRNQNTLEEINLPYVEKHKIHVVRRLSGGGAVYHDLGNLNFSFINNSGMENIHNFQKFTAPVINILNEMGIPALLGGRNDILMEERKISGNAQYCSGNRMVSHGTLLFNSDLSKVAEALNVKMSKIESKGIKSVRSRVANISERLDQTMDILEFRSLLKNGILNQDGNEQYFLSAEDWHAIEKLADERYRKWDWNYGRSPAFNIQRTKRFAVGEIDARIDVQDGEIKSIKIFGDFLGLSDVNAIEQRLMNVQYKRDSLEQALQGLDLREYFGDMSSLELVQFLYG
jgi:lipoate-protein ligase A